MYNIVDLLIKKRHGEALTWEEIEFLAKKVNEGGMQSSQLGALLMSFQLCGINGDEVELLSRAIFATGRRLEWPAAWGSTVASIHSTGTTGNKAKLVLAPAMAACGVKFPVMSARGVVLIGSILGKMVTIPGFRETSDFEEIQKLLETVGCCVVSQPKDIAPAERIIRDTASQIGIFNNQSIKAACLMARLAGLNLASDIIEITCGPSESIATKEEAHLLANKIDTLARSLGLRCRVLVTHVDGPVGKMIGQSLEIQEAMWCLNGEGPSDLTEVVCRLGGYILHEACRADTPVEGAALVQSAIKSGAARKRLMSMLVAQGVDKKDVKAMLKHKRRDAGLSTALPIANYFTHLATDETGFVHNINLSICNRIMYELASAGVAASVGVTGFKGIAGSPCVGGIQLDVQVGSYLNRGETWARIHHNFQLDENQIEKLKSAITLKLEVPLYDMTLNIEEISIAQSSDSDALTL